MSDVARDFLMRLLQTTSPSGDEIAAARVWRTEAEQFADCVYGDVLASSYALINGGNPRVLLAGHIDEIGLMISHIDDNGFCYFRTIGGWDSQVLVGQRIRILGRQGMVRGVIGKKPIHLMTPDDRTKVSKIDDLWIDIGATSLEDANTLISVGASAVIDADPLVLANGRIIGRGVDNRIGAFVVLEALRLLAAERPQASVAAVATAQEEITFAGARTAAFAYDPHVAIAVDVTFATDHPRASRESQGNITIGGGPVLTRGSANAPMVFEMLRETAEQEKIPYRIQANPSYTATDADAIHTARAGIATAVISIPNRYMHSPNEMIDINDALNAARLMAAFVRRLTADTSFVPR
ncbi:MAG: M42 family metallopeptidase [Roseiflexaceae bacterium]|jgi:putative aminopeptidase FrvX